MLKLLGAILVLGAAVIYGSQLKAGLSEHVKQLIGLKEMLLMLAAEISYARAPLKEAFSHIADQKKEPFASLLTGVVEKMEEDSGSTLRQIWSEMLSQHRDSFQLLEEEYAILAGLSENFGYLDVKMQLSNIELYIQQTEVKIVQAQQELANKQKLYQYLSVMCGLFLILVLI